MTVNKNVDYTEKWPLMKMCELYREMTIYDHFSI